MRIRLTGRRWTGSAPSASAGASAPEALVQELLGRLAERYTLSVEERRMTEENVVFRLPTPLNCRRPIALATLPSAG
jgi:hypothetical protein